LGSRCPLLPSCEVLAQDFGTGALDVAGGGEERHGAPPADSQQLVDDCSGRCAPELGAIPAGELAVAGRIVAVPLAQLGAPSVLASTTSSSRGE